GGQRQLQSGVDGRPTHQEGARGQAPTKRGQRPAERRQLGVVMPEGFHLYKTEAIVLDRKDFGEADRLLTLFTPGLGKVRAIAKGARRTTSRLSGHIELFTHTYLFLASGRNLDIVTQSQMIHSHERLREDLWRAALGFHVLELVNHFSEERQDNPGLWWALLDVLARLDEAPELPSPAAAGEGEGEGPLAIAETKAAYDVEDVAQ